ncbi:hypothetical protein V8D89_015059 [Ganoderma adspersum]
MIHTVNIMHPSPAHTSRSKDRQRVASSSSTTTNDTPETLTDAYSHHRSSSLGQEFSVIKMSGTRPSVKGSDPFDPAAFRGSGGGADRATEDLPPWLRGTISTLDTRDPLRLLLLDDVAGHEESCHSAIQSTFDITIASEKEEVPFAFTSPPASSPGLAARLVNTRALPTTTGFAKNDWLFTTNKYSGFDSEIQERRNDTTPLQIPFSTPGPASLLASPMLPRPSAFTTPLVPTISQRGLDEPLSSRFVPFTNPGPCSPTGDTPCMSVATGLLHPHQHVTSSPIQDAPSPVLSLLESPLQIFPFSTAGPNLPVKGTLSIAPDTRFTRSPGPENSRLYTLPSSSPHDQTQQESTPDLYSSSPSTRPLNKPSPPSPRSSPAEHFLFFSQDDALDVARLPSPVAPDDQFEPISNNIDYDSLNFKWERFDRGNIVADSTSASSPPHPGSEETFWKQPAQRLPALAPSAGRRDAPRLDSSPASLRLSGVSTPLLTSPRTPREHFDASKGVPTHRQDINLNPFAWILPPRHAGPPSTPQSKKSSSRRTPRTQALHDAAIQDRFPEPASEPGSQRRHRTGVSDVGGSEVQGHEVRPPERRVPFAPCASIYISPLQRDSENRDEESSGSGQGRLHTTDGITARSTGDGRSKYATAEGCIEALRQDDRMGTPGSGSSAGDPQAVTKSTITVSTQSGGRPYKGEQEEISSEETEEDELEGCSQETRDSIESWTA